MRMIVSQLLGVSLLILSSDCVYARNQAAGPLLAPSEVVASVVLKHPDAKRWLLEAIKVYQQDQNTPKARVALPPCPVPLVALYERTEGERKRGVHSQSKHYNEEEVFQSVAVAYFGALHAPDTDAWVDRMAQAETGRNDDSFPDALGQVYKRHRSAAAFKLLLNLSLDGAAAEVLDFTRFDLFLRDPKVFLPYLRPVRAEAGDRISDSFVYAITGTSGTESQAKELLYRLGRDHSEDGRFLYKYLTMILRRTKQEDEKYRVPHKYGSRAMPTTSRFSSRAARQPCSRRATPLAGGAPGSRAGRRGSARTSCTIRAASR